MPHGRGEGSDPDALAPRRGVRLSLPEPRQGGVDDLLEGQAVHDVLFGRPADLGVDDAVVGEVLGRLAGHPGDALGRLHHRDGVRERLEIALQRAGVGAVAKPLAQLVRVGRW